MRRIAETVGNKLLTHNNFYRFGATGEPSFLTMVENYFDKAARFTNIRQDLLNFYKKPENVVKCSIYIERGIQVSMIR